MMGKTSGSAAPLPSGRGRVLALMGADALALLAAWSAAVLGYDALVGIGGYTPAHYLRLWPLLPAFLAFNAALRLYHGNVLYPAVPIEPVEEFRRLCVSAAFLHLLLMAFLGFARQVDDYSRLITFAAGLLSALLAQPVRNVVRAFVFRFRACRIPVALAGSGETARRVDAAVAASPHLGLRVALRFDETRLRDVVPTCRAAGVSVLLACQDARLFRVQSREFSDWFTHVEFLPQADAFPVFGGRAVSLDGIGGLEMVNQSRMAIRRVQKVALDYALAAVALLLAAPLFALIPLLVKATSRGPVLYRAERLGQDGRPFRIFKFRTMRADADRRLADVLAADPDRAAEYAANFKLRDDPRVTPLGRFLRKTSLDELPQLFNVFRGEMALVGPRPIVEKEVAFYGADYEVVRRVRPGVTGLWQCSGRSDTGYARRIALDVRYVLNWSPWMDLWICLKTATSVLAMKGAV